jgi:hypothetical protein
VLGKYLTLVQTLVAVDAAAASGAAAPIIIRSSSTTSSLLLAPATVVGLSALSALCHVTLHGNNNSNNAPQQQRIRQCVLETNEDLAHVMEKLRCSSTTHSSVTAIGHVMWTLLPLLDRLTNVRPDGSSSSPWQSSPLTNNDDVQILLQWGMLCELILFIITTYDDEEESSSSSLAAAQTLLLRSLQIMCVQSPSLLHRPGNCLIRRALSELARTGVG